MSPDEELLRAFVRDRSETAFRKLAARHLDVIYSVAVRRLGGDTHLAEDAVQEVFVSLSRKAASIRDGNALLAWLHRHTCFVSANMVRSEQRRKAREQSAAEMNALHSETDDMWEKVAPLLDEAIESLRQEDRDAILQRFFAQQDFTAIGATLNISPDAAQKRVSRAVEKLTRLFQKRGILVPMTTLTTLLGANSVMAAPSSLLNTIVPAAFSLSSASLSASLLMTKMKIASAGAFLLACAIAPYVFEHRASLALAAKNNSLRQRFAAPALATCFSQALPSNLPPSDLSSELLRLRSEVSLLKASLASRTNNTHGILILNESDLDDLQPTMTSEESRQILTFDSLKDAGNDTPEALIETYLWTKRGTLNPATFPEAQERFKQIMYVPPGARFNGYGEGVKDDPIRDKKFVKIEAISYLTPDTAKIRIGWFDDGGGAGSSTFRIRREENRWMLDMLQAAGQ